MKETNTHSDKSKQNLETMTTQTKANTELTTEQAQKVFVQNGFNYDLDDAFDTGFQNDFDKNGDPEKWCVLEMSEKKARKYVIENTDWRIKQKEDRYYLIGNNDISGFGFAEEKIDENDYLKSLIS